MLIIKGHTSYYTDYDNKKTNNDDIMLFKLPKVHRSNKLSFSTWYNRFKEDIDNIADNFINSIFKLKSENLIVHYSMKQMIIDFINKLYETSHNSFKNYP
jgi:hypothetical protein